MNFWSSATILRARAIQPALKKSAPREFGKWHSSELQQACLRAANEAERQAKAMQSKAASTEAPAFLRSNESESAMVKTRLIGYRVWMKFSAYNRWYKMKRKRLQLDMEAKIRSGVQRIMAKSKEIISSSTKKVEQWTRIFHIKGGFHKPHKLHGTHANANNNVAQEEHQHFQGHKKAV